MAKYRKKPLVIEAFQMTKERRWNNFDWPNWLHQAWQMEPIEGSVWIDNQDLKNEKLVVGTLDGVTRLDFDDFICKGVKGELYPCKPDIFEQTYELVE